MSALQGPAVLNQRDMDNKFWFGCNADGISVPHEWNRTIINQFAMKIGEMGKVSPSSPSSPFGFPVDPEV